MQERLNRRQFLRFAGTGAAAVVFGGCNGNSLLGGGSVGDKPNFVLIYCDDLGYGDIGCFGSEKHRTPNVDRMAEQGTRFTSFYVTSGVCTPSRSSLMTGCYPRRVNMHQSGSGEWVLFPIAKKGLNPAEITIADMLKGRGYATACVGKWHLGDQPQFLPRRQGFDFYYGIPYSNDMGSRQRSKNPDLPLMRNEIVIEAPAEQTTLTKRYTEEVIGFITANKDKPFFVYLPHTMPHNPVYSSDRFRGKSANGGYGDAVEEIDWSTGEILKALKKLGLDERTLVIFTSDNGASDRFGGSNAPLRGHKGQTFEGGMRVPFVVRWPGKVAVGRTCDELASTIDMLPTFAYLAGTKPPTDRIIDGRSIWPLMAGEKGAKTPHEAFYYYFKDQLEAVRSGKWKLKVAHDERRAGEMPMSLYDLDADIGETTDVKAEYPDVVKRLLGLADKAREDLGDRGREGRNQRPAAIIDDPKPLLLGSE